MGRNNSGRNQIDAKERRAGNVGVVDALLAFALTYFRFRWVALQLSELGRCANELALEQQLAALPRNLDETYERILLRIDDKDRSDVKTFLCWFAFSTRPLTLEEMAETLTVRFNSGAVPFYTVKGRYRDPKDILEKCSSLIVQSKGEATSGSISCISEIDDNRRGEACTLYH